MTTDVVRIGPARADHLLVIISGTHGVEGFAGSGCQVDWVLRNRTALLPANLAVLLVHMLNAYGAAWTLRETEGNVDLNRNFIDHDGTPPGNPLYQELHAALVFDELRGPDRERADLQLKRFRQTHGEQVFVQALAQGQYSHPDGLYYGGDKPVWAHRAIRSIFDEHAQHARAVAVVDIHTGLGPYGYGTPLCLSAAQSSGLRRAQQWYGDSLQTPQAVEGGAPSIVGHSLARYETWLPSTEVTSIVLEFGTYSGENDLLTHRERNWLRRRGDPCSEPADRIRGAFLRHYYPATPDWLEMVAWRGRQVLGQTLQGLISSSR